MTYYRTLGPVTYINGNTVVTAGAGTRIDLTPTQAAALQGQIVVDNTTPTTFPMAPVLFYEYYVLFPAQGEDSTIYFANDTGLFYRWSDASNMYLASGAPANWDSIDTDSRDDLATGESTMSRRYITGTGTSADGTMTLGYFTSRKSETVTQVKTITGPQAQVGATLCRVGLYSVDDAGNLSLQAATPTDTTLWLAANTAYTRSFTSSYNTIRGNRYAIGVLTKGATTAATFVGSTTCPAASAALPPALSGIVTGLTDLPSTAVVANIAASSLIPYAVLLP